MDRYLRVSPTCLFPSPVFEHYCSIVDLYAGIVTNTSILDYGMNTRTGTAWKYLE